MNSYLYSKILLSLYISIFALLLSTTYSLAANHAQESLRVTLNKSETSPKSGLWVKVTLTNVTNDTLHILRWRTPMTKNIGNDMFVVNNNGQRVKYIGPLIKRRSPTRQDYIGVEAGEKITNEIDISKLYDLALKGNYTIQYQLNTNFILEKKNTNTSKNKQKIPPPIIYSNILEVNLISPLVHKKKAKASNFSGCTYSQRIILNQALSASKEMTYNAFWDLDNTYENVPNQLPIARRYREWFGLYDEFYYLTAEINIGEIYLADPITFVCGGSSCDPGDYAYVYSWLPYEIHVCNEFWRAPLRGTDSQAGTIVHETSHFDNVAGTIDRKYGQEECRELANTWPYGAVTNADNYEYFVENNPFLPMSINITPILSMLLTKAPGKSCAPGKIYDCELNCVSKSTATNWTGDGFCDDGSYYIPNLYCPAFQYDGGDCN